MRIIKLLVMSGLLLPLVSYASVVMINTRVIFNADEKEKTLHLSNKDLTPYLIQSWAEDINKKPTNDFILTPVVTRIAAESNQVLRLKKNVSAPPTDRERVYYFLFSQLPAMKRSEADSNTMLIALTNRIKIFVRPAGLTKTLEQSIEDVTVDKQGGRLIINNPTPYYMSIFDIAAVTKNKEKVLKRNVLVAPKSSTIEELASADVSKIKIEYVNDYGALKSVVY